MASEAGVEGDLEKFRTKWKQELQDRERRAKVAAGAVSKRQQQQSPPRIDDSTLQKAQPSSSEQIPLASATRGYTSASFHEVADPLEAFENDAVESVHQTEDKHTRADRLYEEGARYERIGLIASAIAAYRAAHRLDPTVDVRMRDKERSRLRDLEKQKSATDTQSAEQLLSKLSIVETPVSASKVAGASDVVKEELPPLLALPSELLLQILLTTVVNHGLHMIARLVLLSNRTRELASSPAFYRLLCHQLFKPRPPHISLTDQVGALYGGSWFKGLQLTPRIRFDGVYISHVTYLRPVYAETYYTPTHCITYFRYLVFTPRHTVYMLTTTQEPALAIKYLLPFSRGLKPDEKPVLVKGLMQGIYSPISETGLVDMQFKAWDRPGLRARISVEISNRKPGRWDRVKWVEYYQLRDSDPHYRSDIPLHTLRNFHFSHVRSYPQRLL
ncbi:hypothetical protein HDU85_005664 [Gaertneriomyces sp. JEL0708]|nr:hypothetical protein HDU85_005664 [Gaertneriomyces sp. JEL0708]